MNTGFLGPAVATVLTVYGIETIVGLLLNISYEKLQQCLPFTVLKHSTFLHQPKTLKTCCNSAYRLRY